MRTINGAFQRLRPTEARALRARVRPVSVTHQMVMYTERGVPRVIDAQLRPWLVSDHQRRFFHRACLVLKSALARVLPLYLSNPRVRQVVPLEPEEDAWFWHVLGGVPKTPQTVFDRLDLTSTFVVRHWADVFQFLQTN